MEEKDNKLLSERDAAKWFGWSIDKMRQIRKSGQIEYYKFSDQTIKYSMAQLEEYKNRFLMQTA